MRRQFSGLDTMMRAKILILGFALAFSAQPLAAQTSPPDKAPRGASGRINSLSPDEARRAERSRKRAAESGKSAPTAERKEAAPAPKRETVEEFRRNRDRAAEAKPRQPSLLVRKPAERQQARPERRETQRDARRVQRQEKREVQRVEPRRERRARVSPPRVYAARPVVQQPRVGAYVQRDVPLYARPRRYGYGPGYGPRFFRPRFYGPRYVYGPRRFVYGAPYYVQPGPPPFPGVRMMDGGGDDGQ